MSYREENGLVVLTMSHDDYEKLLMVLGAGTAAFTDKGAVLPLRQCLSLLDRLNEGNPDYTPYEVPDGKAS